MKNEYKKIIIELVEVNDNDEEKVIEEYVVYSNDKLGLLLANTLKQFIRETTYESFLDWMEKLMDRSIQKFIEIAALDEFLPKGYFERFMKETGYGQRKIDEIINKTPFIISEFGDDAWYLYRRARIFNFMLLAMKDSDLELALSEV